MVEDTKIGKGTEEAELLPRGYHVQLTFLSGPDRGMVKKLWKAQTVLGRSEADIRVEDPATSKRHAILAYDNNNLTLRDLESTNGTMLNGGRVWEAVLSNLDEITIGQTTIQVSILREADDGVEDSRVEVVESEPGVDVTRTQKAKREQDPLAGDLSDLIKCFLQAAVGPDAGNRFDVQKKAVIIGRSGADVVLNDPDVSRKHASIEFLSQDKVILKDLRSKNGTYLNQHRISVANLKHGDAIQVGATTLNFFVKFGAPVNKAGK